MEERALRELELWQVSKLFGHGRGTGAGAPDEAVQGRADAGEVQDATLVPIMLDRVATATLDELRVIAAGCAACGLHAHRKQAVFGTGAEDAAWMFVGEGPGADEDEQGDPFVGQSGKLLDSMLAAIGCKRGREVYIANVVKCRPPGNRTPTLSEAAACAPYLDRQIEWLAPKVIVALGKSAALRLLGTEASLASLRGRVHRYKDIPVVVTYHPSYLLRTLPEKAKAWEDLVFARRVRAGAP